MEGRNRRKEREREGGRKRGKREGRQVNCQEEGLARSVAGTVRLLVGAGAVCALVNFNSRFSGNKEPCFVVSVSFCGVNNPTRGDFELPT